MEYTTKLTITFYVPCSLSKHVTHSGVSRINCPRGKLQRSPWPFNEEFQNVIMLLVQFASHSKQATTQLFLNLFRKLLIRKLGIKHNTEYIFIKWFSWFCRSKLIDNGVKSVAVDPFTYYAEKRNILQTTMSHRYTQVWENKLVFTEWALAWCDANCKFEQYLQCNT